MAEAEKDGGRNMKEKDEPIQLNESPIVYKCDPKKNTTCRKTSCQIFCFYSLNPFNSVDGKKYRYNANTKREEEVDG